MTEEDQPYPSPESLSQRDYPFYPDTEYPRDWPLRPDRFGARLPTEAEWEVACRSGTLTPFAFGRDAALLRHYGWYIKNSGQRTHAAGEKRPNLRGLSDVHGNVSEWCHDWYDNYQDGTKDPSGPVSGSSRVNRGGHSVYGELGCRSAHRESTTPTVRGTGMGLRPVLSPFWVPPEAWAQLRVEAKPFGKGTEGARRSPQP
jgi:hypothetical protein